LFNFKGILFFYEAVKTDAFASTGIVERNRVGGYGFAQIVRLTELGEKLHQNRGNVQAPREESFTFIRQNIWRSDLIGINKFLICFRLRIQRCLE
jgi:hypothetical protein